MKAKLHMKPIFLIGFMGSGKSYWGKIWAAKNGYSFYDLDTQIEESFKMTVEEIFEKKGEDEFRKKERFFLRKFQNKKNYLVSCGGGTPCFFNNINFMQSQGEVIYLKASPQYILDRVMDETLKRPLLKEVNQSELLFFIQKKLKEREPIYLKAHHVLEVTQLTEDSLAFLQKPLSSEKLKEADATPENSSAGIYKKPAKQKS
ncbi:MAG: shikimate kinase [Bacteroidota bacterium]|nr:shikimate kinase [Bacteroidota bacterium]